MPVVGPTFKAKGSNATWSPAYLNSRTNVMDNEVSEASQNYTPSSAPPWATHSEKRVFYSVKTETSSTRTTNESSDATPNTSTPTTPTFSHRLPASQSPTITLLKKAREGQIPKGASYIDDTKKDENKKYEGIGPTEQGLPVGLRTNIKDEYASDWYRSMFTSLHRPHQRIPPHKLHPSGYASEPEITEYSYSRRYGTLDTTRTPGHHITAQKYHSSLPRNLKAHYSFDDTTSLNNPYLPDPLENHHDTYKNQPRSISEYEPGHSSLAEHEYLMERRSRNKHYGNLFRDGYESDSSMLIKKTGRPLSPADPEKQRAWYREVQRGGEVPIGGLGKLTSPRSPEESPHKYQESEVNIHYRTPVRNIAKSYIDEEELQRRQEIAMRKYYEEQKYRKKLRELEELEAKRHHDYFTPSQKSPIPLNRYDHTYEDEIASTPEPYSIGKAIYNFKAQTSRELSIQKGDIVYILRRVDQNWYEGERHGRVGIFPVKYIEILAPGNAYRRFREGIAKVRYNFIAQTPTELSLFKGEYVVLIRRVDANWYEGRVGGSRGIFPASYVDVLAPPQLSSYLPVSPTSTVRSGVGGTLNESLRSITPERAHNGLAPAHTLAYQNPIPYRAEYYYQPRNSDELELRVGDTVYVVEKCDDGWFVGTSLRTGQFGTFPGNYVTRIW